MIVKCVHTQYLCIQPKNIRKCRRAFKDWRAESYGNRGRLSERKYLSVYPNGIGSRRFTYARALDCERIDTIRRDGAARRGVWLRTKRLNASTWQHQGEYEYISECTECLVLSLFLYLFCIHKRVDILENVSEFVWLVGWAILLDTSVVRMASTSGARIGYGFITLAIQHQRVMCANVRMNIRTHTNAYMHIPVSSTLGGCGQLRTQAVLRASTIAFMCLCPTSSESCRFPSTAIIVVSVVVYL